MKQPLKLNGLPCAQRVPRGDDVRAQGEPGEVVDGGEEAEGFGRVAAGAEDREEVCLNSGGVGAFLGAGAGAGV